MRLVAIVNVWDDYDLLAHCVKNIEPVVDHVIIIASEYSNYGEHSPIPPAWLDRVTIVEPQGRTVMEKETFKRNMGIVASRSSGCTHFISMDCDEFYDQDDFNIVKNRFHVEPDLQGIVCPSIVYFKKPTLSIGYDITLVPHIHKLTPTIKHTFNKLYPYAWSGRQIVIDPTRSFNITSGVEYTSEITMHHFSHCRKDYEKKLRNSSAKFNLDRSTIRWDYANAAPGYFCEFYQKTLVEVPDRFGIGNI